MTNAEAQAHFQDFNHRYFAGTLPRYRVQVVSGALTKRQAVGLCLRKQRLIKLSSWQDEGEQKATLLHEMAHAATNDFHVARFTAEMDRLKAIGAPVSRIDTDPELRVTRARVTHRTIRDEAEDFFMAGSTGTLRQFLRWLVYEQGYRDTQVGFHRRFPWIARVFRDVKKETRAYEKRKADMTQRLVLESGAPQEDV